MAKLRNRITVVLKGDPTEDGNVRLDAFVKALDSLMRSLKSAERYVVPEQGAVHYRILDLKHESPAAVTVGAFPGSNDNAFGTKTIQRLMGDLQHIRTTHTPPPGIDYSTIQAYRSLTSVLQNHVEEIALKNGEGVLLIDSDFRNSLDQAVGRDECEEGSVVGKLDTVNIHQTRRFVIYPALGAERIVCNFPEELLDAVKHALNERVEVFGSLKYKKWSKRPHAIDVKRLSEFADDSALPTLADLRGIAPDVTGGLSVDDFLKKVRDEEW